LVIDGAKRHNDPPSLGQPESRDARGLNSLMSSTIDSFKRIDDRAVSRHGRSIDYPR
jgi:hypothetical protein